MDDDRVHGLERRVATLETEQARQSAQLESVTVSLERLHSDLIQMRRAQDDHHRELMARIEATTDTASEDRGRREERNRIIKWGVGIVGVLVAMGYFGAEADAGYTDYADRRQMPPAISPPPREIATESK